MKTVILQRLRVRPLSIRHSRENNCERRDEIEKKHGTRIPYTAHVVAIKMRKGGRER